MRGMLTTSDTAPCLWPVNLASCVLPQFLVSVSRSWTAILTRLTGIPTVKFPCYNPRFGGCGSLLDLNKGIVKDNTEQSGTTIVSILANFTRLFANESVALEPIWMWIFARMGREVSGAVETVLLELLEVRGQKWRVTDTAGVCLRKILSSREIRRARGPVVMTQLLHSWDQRE